MDDSSWIERLAGMFFQNPDKTALLVVVIAGAWRWIRELIREVRGDAREETLMETIMGENLRLIEENRELRDELNKALRAAVPGGLAGDPGD